RKAEPGALLAGGEEGLEDPLPDLGRDPGAGVADAYDVTFPFATTPDRDRLSLSAGLHRVLQQVHQRRGEQLAISLEAFFLRLHRDAHPPGPGGRREQRAGVLDPFGGLEIDGMQGALAGEGQEVADDAGEVGDLLADPREVGPRLIASLMLQFLGEQAAEELHAAQWVADLVGHAGE